MIDTPVLGVSIQPDAGCARVLAPMLRAGRVGAIEFTVDAVLQGGVERLPEWYRTVIRRFSQAGRLYAHGVGLSAMSGANTTNRQRNWMQSVTRLLQALPCRRLSIHEGWSTAGSVVFGAPLAPPPRSRVAHDRMIERVATLRALVSCPVGIENLAFAWSMRDALGRSRHWGLWPQGQDTPYLHLDVHNVWCQAATWGLPLSVLWKRMPLSAVRVVHVAGGRWSSPIPGRPPVRRDTHDGAIPEAVWTGLRDVVAACPHVEAVVYERIGGCWKDTDQVHSELERLADCLDGLRGRPRPPPSTVALPVAWDAWMDDEPVMLDRWQQAVLSAPSADALLDVLRSTPPYAEDFVDVDERMVHVAHELVARWVRRP